MRVSSISSLEIIVLIKLTTSWILLNGIGSHYGEFRIKAPHECLNRSTVRTYLPVLTFNQNHTRPSPTRATVYIHLYVWARIFTYFSVESPSARQISMSRVCRSPNKWMDEMRWQQQVGAFTRNHNNIMLRWWYTAIPASYATQMLSQRSGPLNVLLPFLYSSAKQSTRIKFIAASGKFSIQSILGKLLTVTVCHDLSGRWVKNTAQDHSFRPESHNNRPQFFIHRKFISIFTLFPLPSFA